MKYKTKRLTESAMLLSVAVVLELVSKAVIPPMPFGGQVTLVSMLPVVLLAHRYGVRWGMACGLSLGLIEMALGGGTVTAAFQPGYFGDGAMIFRALAMVLLDYVLAYAVLGLGGCVRGLMAAAVVSLTARYCVHVLSGWLLFSGWAEWFFTQEGFPAWGAALADRLSPGVLGLAYSLVYNGTYMVPEIILTAAAALLAARIPQTAERFGG